MSLESLPPQGQAQGSQHKGAARSYLYGMLAALALTAASFWVASTELVYAPGVPILLGVLAIAQMGVHLVFFLHLSSAPDQANNFLALAFGVLLVGVVVFGSMLIMHDLDQEMKMPLHARPGVQCAPCGIRP